MKIKKQLTTRRLRDRLDEQHTLDGTNVSSRVIASLLVAASGILLYSDKIFNLLGLTFEIPEKFSSTGMPFETFVWLWAQTLSPLFIIFASLLKPFRYVYLIPLFCYLLQTYTLAFDSQDFTYTSLYAIGTAILVFVILELLKRFFKRSLQAEIESMKEEVLENIENVR
ncbi:hypothetical protein [Maribacter sp. 2-571]|uniref:hypothetical protein n=1 Tax=Maribacter sp. 2-571 TaxID=3417569 RepID=UPI003D332A42